MINYFLDPDEECEECIETIKTREYFPGPHEELLYKHPKRDTVSHFEAIKKDADNHSYLAFAHITMTDDKNKSRNGARWVYHYAASLMFRSLLRVFKNPATFEKNRTELAHFLRSDTFLQLFEDAYEEDHDGE